MDNLARCLTALGHDVRLFIRRDCRTAAEHRFDMHRMARDYADLYRRLLAARTTAARS
ncbi:hypothetical protein [Nocardia sp. NPDC049149]|uniref:hypothetical protein n=1 Tax=Nocardia sp. NPDC049149 TaxID=3364315 RepID=UPI0037238FEE